MSQNLRPHEQNNATFKFSSNRIWPPVQLNLPANPLAQGATKPGQNSTFRQIVVPLDGTSLAEHAIPTALAIANRFGARLRTVYTYSRRDLIDPWRGYFVAEDLLKSEREQHRYVLRVSKWLSRNSQLSIETLLVEGADNKQTLLKSTAGADLIVMASRQSSIVSRLWSNREIDWLRQQAKTPLLLVPGDSTPVNLYQYPRLKHILVLLDGSVESERILSTVEKLTRVQQASLVLLHVCKERPHSAFDGRGEYFASVVQRYPALASFIKSQVVINDRWITDAIAVYAKEYEMDLIALATRNDTALSRLLRGSVLDGLIQRVEVPILAHPFSPKS